MSSAVARVAVDALGMTPRNYGHLIQMAARYARFRLNGHAVVNRQTGTPVMLDSERGLKNATAPGMPPVLLLAVPAMLAAARYLGPLAPRPPCPQHVLRYHAFAAKVEVGGRSVDVSLIVQENRQHRLYLDRVLGGEALPQRNAGGANSDAPNPAIPPAGNAPSPHSAAASLADEPRGASTISSPVAARVAVDALGMTPRNYGHLIQMAARYARFRLDGHSVVNRQTRAPIMLTWPRGLENVTAPGMPPVLLQAVPAIPAMVATARYIGVFTRPSPPPDVVRYHAFATAADVAGRRLDVALIVRENRRDMLFLDRMLTRPEAPHRDLGGATTDFGVSSNTWDPGASIASLDPQPGSSDGNIVVAQVPIPAPLPVPGVPPSGPASTPEENRKLGNAFIHLVDPRPLFDALGTLVHNEPPPDDKDKDPKPPATPDSGPPASAPVGSSKSPIEIQKGTNAPANIDGTDYTGHAIDRTQGRGLPPSVVNEVVKTGQKSPGERKGTTDHYDPTNNITVTTDTAAGRIVTVRKGRP